MITLFLSPSCTSCRKARAWLKKHDVPFKEHNIMTSPLSKQELTSILALTENGTDELVQKFFKNWMLMLKIYPSQP